MTQIELKAVADCWATDIDSAHNYNGDGLGAGISAGFQNRSFLKFNTLSLPISENEITKAEIRLYGRKTTTIAEARAHYCITGFSETTLNWNNQPPVASYDVYGNLMGKQTNIPNTLSWFSIPLNIVFVKRRIGQYLFVILKGSGEQESYFYASDKEESAGLYAPTLVISTGGAKAAIDLIELPSELTEGALITGRITLRNIGTATGLLRCRITTYWNSTLYTSQGTAEPDTTLTVDVTSLKIPMPPLDAVILIEAQHDENGTWITDDTKTH